MKHFLFILLLNLPFLAFSQFKESFLTENLPESWIGDRNSFVISNKTLVLNGKDETETVSLALPYDLKEEDKEWEFTLNLNLTPSNSNWITIFPASSTSNVPTGFFFRAGYNSSNRIRFGTDPNNLLQCNRYDKHKRTILQIRICLKENRYWTVYSRNLYEDNSQLQELGTLDAIIDFPKSAFFCIQIRHTKTHKTDFGIRNISYQTLITEEPEKPIQPEESNIKLLSIEPLSLYEIKFVFNIPVSKDKAKFYIAGDGYAGKCEANRVVYGNEEQTSIFINFTNPMALDKDYTFYIENLYDLSGQSVLNEEIPVRFQVEDEGEEKPEEPEEKPEKPEISYPENSIRINEVMADPKGLTLLPETEYVELYNSLDQEVSLNGFSLEYDNRIKVPLDGMTIPATSFAVLYRSGREIDSGQSLAYPLDKFPSALANTGKNLKLRDANGNIINEYTYPQAEPAHSWEYDLKGWHLSTDKRGGTPGECNSDGVKEEEEKPEEPQEPEEPEEKPDIPVVPEEPTEEFQPDDIRINEVMADPKGLTLLPETEYIELYNSLDHPIKLNKWILKYDNREIDLKEVSIPSDGYVILYRTGNEMNILNGSAYPLDDFPSALANSGKTLALFDPSKQLIDQYSYPQAKPARSWEYSLKGWHLSTDKRGGTPGECNSDGVEEEEEKPEEPEKPVVPEEPTIPSAQMTKAGDIIFNELLPEPFIGGEEYIELLNRSDKTLCIKDLCISTRKTDGSLNTHYPLKDYYKLLEPGDYLLLTKSMDKVEAFYNLPASLNYLECKLPVLSNSGSSIVLYREETEEIIDEVRYSPKWHAPTIKDHKGIALERINPDKDSQDPNNWTSAATAFHFGTPGEENSQHLSDENIETGNEYISDPIYQPSGHYIIPYQLDQAGYSARGWIFDLSGRKVAVLADNEQLGTNGSLDWNGQGNNGSNLDSGVYILYIELWHPNGSVIRKKKAFLVH